MGEFENRKDLKGFTVENVYWLIHFVHGIPKKPHSQTHTAIQKMESLSGSYTATCHLWRTDVNWRERKRTKAARRNIDLYSSAVFFPASPKPPQFRNSCRSRRPTRCDLTQHPLACRLSRKASPPLKLPSPSHKRC